MLTSKKKAFYVLAILISIASCSYYLTSNNSTEIETINVSLRDIGHKLLLQNNDSTSLVLPIKKKSDDWFEISFGSKISISPVSLTKTVNDAFNKLKLPANYIVEVRNCELNEIVYSYKVSVKETETTIPCLSRNLPKACYTLNIKFLSSSKNSFRLITYNILIGILIILFFLFNRKKRKNNINTSYTINKDVLNVEERILTLNDIDIPLTEKEVEILTLFFNKPNQVISREELQKEIWENKGVIVGRSLDTYISKLRKKLNTNSSIKIINIRGIGYKMEV